MVVFKLDSPNEVEAKYEYYPNGNKEYKPGVILIDIAKMKIKEIIPSEQDFYVKHTVEELNKLRNDANQMRIESGRPEITEEEWPPATEDIEYFKYAQHVIDKIDEMYEINGVFPSEGIVAWY